VACSGPEVYELQPLPKDYRSLFRLAEAQGWEHTRTGKDHHKFVSPSGEIVVTSGTPSDRRALDNFRAQLKRHGLRPYMPLKEDKTLNEPKTVISKVEGDSTTPVPPVGVVNARSVAARKRVPLEGAIMLALRQLDKEVGLSAQEILAAVTVQTPQADIKKIGQALSNYAVKGKIARVGQGRYRIKNTSTDPAETDDFKVLEEALTVLAKLEGVVRRMQEREKLIQEARAAFAAIK
jgi:hypothetical protein